MSSEFTRLTQTIAMLRDPKDGCPWDLEQDFKSLLPYLVEESYEYIQAVKVGDFKEMEEELGDVLLQVLLHAQLGKEEKAFDIHSVCKKLNEKMIRRHPHVFTNKENRISIDKLHENWEKIKTKEKASKNQETSFSFTDKDLSAPPLMAAWKIGKKSKKVDFDWDNIKEVRKKVTEELGELDVEIKNNNSKKIKEELGDLLFSVVQLARHLKVDAHNALYDANYKFIKRFQMMETEIGPQKITTLTRKEKEDLWKKVKKQS